MSPTHPPSPLQRRTVLRALLCAAALPPARAADGAGTDPSRPARADTPALLVVDAQVGVLATVWQRERIEQHLRQLVDRARAARAPVLWVQHADGELPRGSQGWQLAEGFVPRADEPVIHKRYNSSFARTDLDAQLRARGVTRIVLAGAATNWCIRATAYAALDRGYDLTLVADAHSTEPMRLDGGRVIEAQAIVDELNTALRWIAVPDVHTAVMPTADVRFERGPAR